MDLYLQLSRICIRSEAWQCEIRSENNLRRTMDEVQNQNTRKEKEKEV